MHSVKKCALSLSVKKRTLVSWHQIGNKLFKLELIIWILKMFLSTNVGHFSLQTLADNMCHLKSAVCRTRKGKLSVAKVSELLLTVPRNSHQREESFSVGFTNSLKSFKAWSRKGKATLPALYRVHNAFLTSRCIGGPLAHGKDNLSLYHCRWFFQGG